MGFSVCHALLLFISSAIAQFVPPPTDLQTVQGNGFTVRFKQVPNGICETNPNVKSFAGYVDVTPTQHMYFMFFEARNGNPTQAPLTVRLDGGPGASSMNGLFSEIGPCSIDSAGKVVNNPNSFSSISNMLFVDQPATVGFSFTIATNASQSPQTALITPTQSCTTADPGCGTFSSPDVSLTPNGTAAAAPIFYSTMQGFMGAFPQYSANGVHINTQSYGGHYGPIFADYIVKQNKLNTPGTVPIPLKSLTIEDGFYDTRVQFAAYYNYTVQPGNPYDLKPYTPAQQQQLFNNVWGPGGCQEQQAVCNANPPPANIDSVCGAADNFCVSNVEEFFDINALRSETDIRELSPDPFPSSFFVSYLNRADVQKAIGATTNFTQASVQTFIAFNSTGDDSRTGELITKAMTSLLQEGVTVAMFGGDADYDSNLIGAQIVADNVGAPGWPQAGIVNMTALTNGQIPGETRQADGFSFTRLYFAGHFSAFHAPEAALRVFERAMTGMDIATGTMPMALGKNITTKGSQTSTFREGSGTVQTKAVPAGAIYNPDTHLPEIPAGLATTSGKVIDTETDMLHPLAGITSKNMRKMVAQQ
ncbi:alpha/beta-hydrolase [Thozetella sp. PMI_491]|nr:alpha/beta-hydrolase [Thozetella sp. PMI_491]